MKDFIIRCRVTLNGATMCVEASSPEEALKKAKAGEWEDVTYDFAELVDWEPTGEPEDMSK